MPFQSSTKSSGSTGAWCHAPKSGAGRFKPKSLRDFDIAQNLERVFKMKKLLLVNPSKKERSGFQLSQFTNLPPLGLAYVAAATPDNWEIKIIDENVTPFEYESADLVGISAFTTNINRGYTIANGFRQRGTKVVMGGVHVSMLPEEALNHADSVVVGEAEGIWGKVIKDFEAGRMARKYTGNLIDLNTQSLTPRRDLLSQDYLMQPVLTARGCPFKCSFCAVTRFFGARYRQRSVEDVMSELEKIAWKYIGFVDDNLVGDSPENRKRAAGIFRGMIDQGMKKTWFMQTSVNATEDEELIELAGRAGCAFAFIGFETIKPETLQSLKKRSNLKLGVKNYLKAIDTFHRAGIAVMGSFMIGNDGDDPAYCRRVLDFMLESGVDVVQISILTPLPGTPLMEKIVNEGRLVCNNFPEDWEKFRMSWVTFKPIGMDADLIYRGINFIKKNLYDPARFQQRMLRSFINLKGATSYKFAYGMNKALEETWKNAHYYDPDPEWNY